MKFWAIRWNVDGVDGFVALSPAPDNRLYPTLRASSILSFDSEDAANTFLDLRRVLGNHPEAKAIKDLKAALFEIKAIMGMLKDDPLQRENPYTCKEGQQQTVYALQEFFIGEWSDHAVTTNRGQAISDYRTFRNTHYRQTRLICRTETVLAIGKEDDERD